MEIIRINSYQDHRFSQEVLNQHGGFLVNGEPYEIKIVSASEAVIKGPDSGVYEALIEVFCFLRLILRYSMIKTEIFTRNLPQKHLSA